MHRQKIVVVVGVRVYLVKDDPEAMVRRDNRAVETPHVAQDPMVRITVIFPDHFILPLSLRSPLRLRVAVRNPRGKSDTELDFVHFWVSNMQPEAAWSSQSVELNRDRGEQPMSEKSIRPRDADGRWRVHH